MYPMAENGFGLDAQKQLSKVAGLPNETIRQLLYDPSVTPASLYVLTGSGLVVLRGY